MLIEQIIEFELREPRPHGRICTYATGYFHDVTKQKSKEYCRVDHFIIYCYKILQDAMYCTLHSLPGPNHVQNLTPKCKILNVFWTKIVSKWRVEQFIFLSWLSSV